ncbi:RHS repeat domain-containing protein [Arthrobacter sp. YN]|uniref:RHS repeat domain-containing protein n=1 Tax=Arthrobacter sp. YN TaxID=2020486 RepID=UPI0018E06466|nr:RHS repeat protein [Arthrobacter sp. YN]
MGWEYDGDGNRTGFTDPTGTTTRYARDPAGRVVKVSNPLLGDAAFTHDPSGRVTTATAGKYSQEWVYRGGNLSEHTRTTTADNSTNPAGTADVTLIGREDGGRITGLSRGGVVTRYGYDAAGQMVSATTTDSHNASASGSVVGWELVVGRVVAGQAVRSMALNVATSTLTRATGNAAVIARRFGANLLKDMVGSGAAGGVTGTADYVRERVQKGGPWTAQGLLGSATGGASTGVISGALSPAAGHVTGKGAQFLLSASVNTGAGFAGDMLKSGVNGEAFDPIKSLVSSTTSGVFSTGVSTSRGNSSQGYADLIGTSTSSPIEYFTKANMTTDLINSLIGLGTNGMIDEAWK